MKSFSDLVPNVGTIIKKESNSGDTKGEPGNKTPISDYKQVGQYCDTCEDITMHVYSKKTNKVRCLNCKTTTQL